MHPVCAVRAVIMSSGTVKFFNEAKGFGFIAPDEGGNDVFVHISAVVRSGVGSLNEGDRVTYELEQDRRSGKFTAVDLRVIGGAPASDRARRPSPAGRSYDRAGPDRGQPRRGANSEGPSRAPAGSGSGVVKWFNPTKGFGFIQPSDGGGEVFVYISQVERAGLSGLDQGQAVSYEIEQDRRTGKASATNLQFER
jgi:CspA family cold shock protein